MWDIQDLFVRHARGIERFLRRRGHNSETAADLTQDTFLRVMTASSQVSDDNPKAYLHQIARNLSIDLIRRERRVEHAILSDEEILQVSDQLPSPEAIVYDRQRLAIVARALEELPYRSRQAFEMHRLGQQTLADISAHLGLSTTRTWALIRQAYLHLRSRLNDAQI